MEFEFTRASVRSILERPDAFEWSWQGLGMLRTYLDRERVYRLHLWSPSHANENVSTIHDHPWDFASLVVSGQVGNVRYAHTPDGTCNAQDALYRGVRIKCGEGGCAVSRPFATWLRKGKAEFLSPGDCYSQRAPELHETFPSPGAVTIIRRVFGSDSEHAHVFWQQGEWVSAEPRPATPGEVAAFTRLALENWQTEEQPQ